MIPLSSAVSSGLTWSKIPRSRNHELRCNGEVVGTLARPRFWGAEYEAETEHGRWTFRRGGFLGTGAEIVDTTSGEAIARFKSSWSARGTLTFADGQTFRFECKGWWRPVWSVTTDGGQPVLLLHVREKTVELPAGAVAGESRLALLVMFAWYRILQAEEDAASAATVTMIVAG